ncbi:putative polyhydroxyalkanoic acid system protein [Roseateles sp. YR242]|uniref:polyhydroxyalkanoic acid system family protein n=1 Tax=Roseateles sp. YR242 TaxID=1855305 RepID=UPI0008D572B2|nr:polyhydroxyalkanoic acid system family protein [Roseateles sp. YR242]SEL72819.1 putative polyhydroxyalkanoic acid system protein [Roseateles sp. YR242]
MADIQVHRTHAFGLTRARAIALSWAEELEERYGMECTIHEGDDSDTVTFVRDGVNGSLEVTGSSFELQAKLGFLLSAFRKQIETEVGRVLDALLAKASGAAAKVQVTKVKSGGKVAGKTDSPAVEKPRRRR